MKRRFITAAISAAAVMLCTVPAYAAGNKISTIRLEVNDNMQVESALDEEEELEIDTSADDYAIAGWEIMNERITWELTDVPEVQVTLITEDDYYFSVSKGNVKIKGDDAEVVSVKKENSQEIIVTLRLLPMSQRVGKVAYAEWDGKTAVWAPAAGALSYDVYLLRDSRVVGSKRTTSETTYDFGVALNKEGEYYYKVRPVGGEGVKEGAFTESDSIYRSEDDLEAEKAAAAGAKAGTEAADAAGTDTAAAEGTGTDTAATAASSAGEAGTWVQDGAGWRFFRTDGSQQYNDWLFINGKWYYFEADGRMKTGWLLWKELWYYLGPDGDMWVNCQTPDGYFVNQDGVWVQ